jgi:hypothetical protein
MDPQTKRSRNIGTFASEEDAARAYDRAAVQAHGTGVKRNFPGEAISELPETVGEERKRSNGGSRYIGVNWDKARSLWLVQRYDPQTQRSRHIGYYASEEDAARAYDYAAVQARGADAKRNFPGEAVNEPPATVRKQRSSSIYIGVMWHKTRSLWETQLWDPRSKRRQLHWVLCLRGGRSQGVRLYSCAGVGSRCQAQLPRRGDQRVSCESGEEAEGEQQLALQWRHLGQAQVLARA